MDLEDALKLRQGSFIISSYVVGIRWNESQRDIFVTIESMKHLITAHQDHHFLCTKMAATGFTGDLVNYLVDTCMKKVYYIHHINIH